MNNFFFLLTNSVFLMECVELLFNVNGEFFQKNAQFFHIVQALPKIFLNVEEFKNKL